VRAPPITYRYIYPKDVAGPTLEGFVRHRTVVAAATQIEQFVTGIPKDRILVLTNVCMECAPGAAQILENIAVQGFTSAGLQFNIALERPDPTVSADRVLNWTGEVWITGRGEGVNSMRLNSVYDLGVANNTTTFTVFGFIIPRANVAPF